MFSIACALGGCGSVIDDPFDVDVSVDEQNGTTDWDDLSADIALAATDPFVAPHFFGGGLLLTVADPTSEDVIDPLFTPAGCAGVDRDGGLVIYTLDACTGPHDSASVDGAVRAPFTGTVTWTAGSRCVASAGSGRWAVNGRELDVSLEGYARCAGACPTGGVMTLSDDEAAATLTFGDGDTATLQRIDGRIDSIDLNCD